MNILPGWFPAGAAIGKAGPATSLTFQASATSTDSADITAPASIKAGDLLILVDMVLDNSTPNGNIPSGFTLFQDDARTSSEQRGRITLSGKIADGSEAGATLTGSFAPDANSTKILFVFRPDNPITSMVGFSGDAVATAGTNDPAAQTVTIGGNEAPLAIIAGYSPTGTTRLFSPAEDDSIVADGKEARYKIYNSSPQDTTVDMGDELVSVKLLACVGVAVS